MENNTQTQTNTKAIVAPENAVTFEMYKLWRSLPIAHMLKFGNKGMSKEDIAEGIATDLGITDPLFVEVFTFTTQKQWAERFGLGQDTISHWNKKVGDLDPLMEAKQWANKMTKNVVFNLYRRAATSSDSFAMKLYLQVVNEWQEKNTLNIHIPDVAINLVPMRTRDEQTEFDAAKKIAEQAVVTMTENQPEHQNGPTGGQ